MPPPDMVKMRELGVELARLIAAGEWNREAFERLRIEARAASNGDGRALEWLYNEADPSWFPPIDIHGARAPAFDDSEALDMMALADAPFPPEFDTPPDDCPRPARCRAPGAARARAGG